MTRSPEECRRARKAVARRLSKASLRHSERTAQTAVTLARRFGVNRVAAELAGLLHDYARDEDSSELVETAEGLGVPVSAFEREHPWLLHARVGSAMVRHDLPGMGEAVLSAIAVHTVGAVPMSDLDKVLYIADMIEPGRDHPGLDDLRAACESETLDECFRLAYGRTLRHLEESGRPVHPVSNAVVAEIERETGRSLYDPEPVAVWPVDPVPDRDAAPAPDTAPGEDDAPAEDDVAADESDDAADPGETTTVARHGRRRRYGRSRRRTSPEEVPERAPKTKHPLPGVLVRAAKTAGTLLLVAVVMVGALWGLALGINAFARWNARRLAAAGTTTSRTSENLLVVGVRGGVAVGFTALKLERDTNRVLGIAIPEAAFVEVPGRGFERVGASYSVGPAVSESAVSNYFGVQFTRYIAVDGNDYQALLQNQNIGVLTDKILKTDLTASEQSSTASFLKQVGTDNVWIVPLPVKAMTAGSERYFEPQRAQVADLLFQWWGIRADQQKPRTRVIVYDGVGTPGLATEAAQQLIRAGFQVVDSGSAEHFGYATTTILVYHAPSEASAVRDALGVGTIQAQSAPQELTDMIVIIGKDYLPPVSAPSTEPTEGAR